MDFGLSLLHSHDCVLEVCRLFGRLVLGVSTCVSADARVLPGSRVGGDTHGVGVLGTPVHWPSNRYQSFGSQHHPCVLAGRCLVDVCNELTNKRLNKRLVHYSHHLSKSLRALDREFTANLSLPSLHK